MRKENIEKKSFDLDLVGLSLKTASNKIFHFDPELRLSIFETKSYKDHEQHNLYDGIVIRQSNKKKSVELTIAYF